jgi:hypothetical protein
MPVPQRGTASVSPPPDTPAVRWHQPAVVRLSRTVSQEAVHCWLLVALAALAAWPLGHTLAQGVFLGLPLMLELLTQLDVPAGMQVMLPSLGMLAGLAGLVQFVTALALPVLVVLFAIASHKRQKQLAQRDLVWGHAALMLIDEQYGQLIDQARRQRYRPNPNPVELGNDFSGRVNHFAHYYKLYYRLGHAPAEFRVPVTFERNCWIEGLLAAIGACPFCCLLAVVIIPRIILVWPRHLAIKQAVLEYLQGRYDAALEQQYSQRHPGTN